MRSIKKRVVAIGVATIGLVGAFVGGALATHNFSDVPSGAYYHGDVSWLVDNGITAGCGSGRYCPNSAVTRGQMARFLHNFAGVTQTGAYGCDMADFLPNNAGTNYFFQAFEGRVWDSGFIQCGVHPPDGAVVTSLKVRVWDDHTSTNVSCAFGRRELFGPGPNSASTVAQTGETSGASGIALLSGDSFTTDPVDTTTYTYFITCGQGDSDVDGQIGIYGATVEYTNRGVPAP